MKTLVVMVALFKHAMHAVIQDVLIAKVTLTLSHSVMLVTRTYHKIILAVKYC